MRDDTRVEESKFEIGVATPAFEAGPFPWGYGDNRITAMVRDPDSAYVYWEITDEGIAAARAGLGPSGAAGWCNLRVYDTTGRDFDGTNANDYFDIRVERDDREYFVMIRRPTSTMHAEIGLRTVEGYFQPIARTGRAEFPRKGPSSNTTLDWMTVTSDDMPPAVAPFRSRYTGPAPSLPERAGAGYVDVWRAAYAPSMPQESRPPLDNASSSGSGIHRTFERTAHIERWWHLDEWRSEWRAGLRFSRRVETTEGTAFQWHEGPFAMGLSDPERIAVEILGEPTAKLASEGVEFTLFGPWRVTIRGAEMEPRRRVLATWSMRWVRATTPMTERWKIGHEQITTGYQHEEVTIGGSEQSGLLERGASELWRLGASERMWMGASEWVAAGASETQFLGASRWGFAGASAFAWVGGSEWLGASERLGASEFWRLGGGSSPLGGASEQSADEGRAGVGDPPSVDPSGERWGGRLEEV